MCFDPQHRLALARFGSADPAGPWTLPSQRQSGGESCDAAAARLVTTLASPGVLRFGAVTGRAEVISLNGAARPRRPEAHIFTAHVRSASALNSAGGGGALRWIPYGDAARAVHHLGIPDLGNFLDGYVNGWIPDGWITLC